MLPRTTAVALWLAPSTALACPACRGAVEAAILGDFFGPLASAAAPFAAMLLVVPLVLRLAGGPR